MLIKTYRTRCYQAALFYNSHNRVVELCAVCQQRHASVWAGWIQIFVMKTHQHIGLSISSLYTVLNLHSANVSQSLCESRPNPAAWFSDVGCYLQSGIMLEGAKSPSNLRAWSGLFWFVRVVFFFLMFNMKSVGGKHLIPNHGHIVVYKCFPPLSPHLTVHKEPSLQQ